MTESVVAVRETNESKNNIEGNLKSNSGDLYYEETTKTTTVITEGTSGTIAGTINQFDTNSQGDFYSKTYYFSGGMTYLKVFGSAHNTQSQWTPAPSFAVDTMPDFRGTFVDLSIPPGATNTDASQTTITYTQDTTILGSTFYANVSSAGEFQSHDEPYLDFTMRYTTYQTTNTTTNTYSGITSFV